nr:phage baseplate assembly protein V [uncultured Holophaga sp.]
MSAPEQAAPTWRRGLVTAVAGHQVRVKFPDLDGMISGLLPVASLVTLGARVWAMPRVGAQVVVLLDENGEDGVVLGGVYSTADPAPSCSAEAIHAELEDGTAVTLQTGKVVVDTPGDVEAQAGGTATLKATKVILDAPLVQATQVLQVDGVIQANGGITTSSGGAVPGSLTMGGDVVGGTISLQGHTHTAQGSTAETTTAH